MIILILFIFIISLLASIGALMLYRKKIWGWLFIVMATFTLVVTAVLFSNIGFLSAINNLENEIGMSDRGFPSYTQKRMDRMLENKIKKIDSLEELSTLYDSSYYDIEKIIERRTVEIIEKKKVEMLDGRELYYALDLLGYSNNTDAKNALLKRGRTLIEEKLLTFKSAHQEPTLYDVVDFINADDLLYYLSDEVVVNKNFIEMAEKIIKNTEDEKELGHFYDALPANSRLEKITIERISEVNPDGMLASPIDDFDFDFMDYEEPYEDAGDEDPNSLSALQYQWSMSYGGSKEERNIEAKIDRLYPGSGYSLNY